MRNIKLAVGIVAVVSALGVGAASASASEFESSTGGGPTKGNGIGLTETFSVYPMIVTCSKITSKGTAPGVKFASLTTEITYGSCTTFGGALKVTVTKGNFTYNAEGTETINTPITITPSLLKCHYEIPAQSTFVKQSVIFGDEEYFGNPKFIKLGVPQLKLNIYTALSGVEYTAHAWPCVGPKTPVEQKELEETGTEGKFSGAIKEEVSNGDLTWLK